MKFGFVSKFDNMIVGKGSFSNPALLAGQLPSILLFQKSDFRGWLSSNCFLRTKTQKGLVRAWHIDSFSFQRHLYIFTV